MPNSNWHISKPPHNWNKTPSNIFCFSNAQKYLNFYNRKETFDGILRKKTQLTDSNEAGTIVDCLLSPKGTALWLVNSKRRITLTWPLSSMRLLVSLSLSKETICFIHCAPFAGESGWTWIRPGMCGSAFPATTHEEEWKLKCLGRVSKWQLWKGIGNVGKTKIYSVEDGQPTLVQDTSGNWKRYKCERESEQQTRREPQRETPTKPATLFLLKLCCAQKCENAPTVCFPLLSLQTGMVTSQLETRMKEKMGLRFAGWKMVEPYRMVKRKDGSNPTVCWNGKMVPISQCKLMEMENGSNPTLQVPWCSILRRWVQPQCSLEKTWVQSHLYTCICSACRRRERSPSWACSPTMGPDRTTSPGTLGTSAWKYTKIVPVNWMESSEGCKGP